jgi:transposase InsO family protein
MSSIISPMEADFCAETLEEEIGGYGKPKIFNSDQGSQLTSEAFINVLLRNDIAISMYGKARGGTTCLSSGSGSRSYLFNTQRQLGCARRAWGLVPRDVVTWLGWQMDEAPRGAGLVA